MNKMTLPKKRHLHAVKDEVLPSTLRELASDQPPNIALYQKLGKGSLWLFAEELWGTTRMNDTVVHYLGDTGEIPVPVWYRGLRVLTGVEDNELNSPAYIGHPVPHEETVAVFGVNENMHLYGEDEIRAGQFIQDYPEVIVRLDQKISILDQEEYTPGRRDLFMLMDDPELELVYSDEQSSNS